MLNILREPARLIGLIKAILAVLVAFGVHLGLDQQDAILQAVTEALALIAIIVLGNEAIRARVTPVADPNLPVGTPVNGGTAEVVPTREALTGADYRGEGA